MSSSNPSKLAPKQKLRKKLIKKYMYIATSFYFEGTEEEWVRKNDAPEFADEILALFSSLLDELVPAKESVADSPHAFLAAKWTGFNEAIEQFTEKRKELGI